ncbi:MAG TPA: zf-HC2 domain-containing protein, partial [Longimicrobium sp.]
TGTMTHEQAIERLDDYASGELPDIERVMVQRHLDGCGHCRAEVEAIRALLVMAHELPSGIAPRRDLWEGIAGRLEPRAPAAVQLVAEETKVIPLAPRRRPWTPPRWALQAAAAVVLVASSSAVTAVLMRQQGPAGTVAVGTPVHAARPATAGDPGRETEGTAGANTPASPADPAAPGAAGAGGAGQTAFAAFRPAEQDYQRAIDDLVRVLETKRGQLAPETVRTLETNLKIIDAAISESRAALEKDPNSRELTQMLSATYDAKVQMLRQAVEL